MVKTLAAQKNDPILVKYLYYRHMAMLQKQKLRMKYGARAKAEAKKKFG